MKQIKILTARRAYEFRPDDLRLSMASSVAVQQLLQAAFRFQAGQIGTPMQTFGPVANAIPPGLVLDYGSTQTPEGTPTPLRFMHFEPQRLVIDVAGPSSAIDWTFEHLQNVLDDTRSPDGSPIIGEPRTIRDYSEISVNYDFDLEDLIDGPLLQLARKATSEEGRTVMPVSIRFRPVDPTQEVHPNRIGQTGFSQGELFEYRAGTKPGERVFFSASELSTEQHVAWLESLERELSKV